ncbi:MAG: PTS sugar transporter subunit IIA [Selenomonas sp.]|jgi:PTS system fructose-specific IIC component|nr:PTS sugar transporter subunit IIA [Selenomonas sp.]MCI7330814.1 fructose-specific PTS transporter subunit EIIC [Selenomonadaceae bacterium]MDD7055726.1 fructose-specific PTS transporter subunit EIIC [Selenomonadaceae bacterium]MDY3916650.1 fructose-specific PTS transporter subunit EIIC [Selenomonadaceae bacterium]
MRITELLKRESIVLGAHPEDKQAAISQLAELMNASGNLSDADQYKKDVLAREAQGTTGLGDGIATPHAKSAGVKAAGLAAMTVPQGMDFESMDGNPARLFFMIAAPDSANDEHLAILSKLATMIMDPDFKEALIAARDKDEFLKLIDDKEAGRFQAPAAATEETAAPTADHIQVLAVTACPTGIAHTFMAAESLEQHAKKRGISIKVETNGSGGAKNILTDAEIAAADGIIVAADKNVAMSRFNGKHVVITKVADGINKADELIDRALSGKAPIYHASGADEVEGADDTAGESIGRQIYKHLMNGVSHMLPFVVGGGILIALAFLFDTFDPANPGNFGSNTPLAKFFKDTGGAAFGFMLPVLAGFISMSIADRPGLAVGFVGGALAGTTGSGFLGALLAGFLGGYLVNWLKKFFKFLPQSLDGIKPVLLYPFFGILLMGVIMTFIIAPPVSGIMTWMTDTLKNMDPNARILLGIVMGGMMAVDMGGPINKAAYVTGTGLLASGEYHVMAAVMAGGMVPPLAIALCTTFFKNRFTESEQKAGITNYVMGLSFITEGAIPFAAGDPLRVIPACIAGSATAGALSMAFDCTLRAPHGGIFVVPTIGNPLMYLVAIFIGAIVGCAVLSVLKKPLKK